MPFVITGRTKAEVETAKTATRLHIAFYASTRTYQAVLRFHGWEEAGQRLHGLSLLGNWPEMGKLITDEMLDQFAVVGTYDEVGRKIRERWGDVSPAVFVPLPQGANPDEIQSIVNAVHQG